MSSEEIGEPLPSVLGVDAEDYNEKMEELFEELHGEDADHTKASGAKEIVQKLNKEQLTLLISSVLNNPFVDVCEPIPEHVVEEIKEGDE